MNKIKNTGIRGFARSLAALTTFSLMLTGCAGVVQNVLVTLPEYQAKISKDRSSISSPARIRIGPVKEARTEFVGRLIGKKTTIGNIYMGHIEMSPLPTELIAQLLRSELGAAGHTITDSGEDFSIDTQLYKFRVLTPGTAIYWDVTGTVDILIRITGPGGKKHEARYATTCTDRTYVWPSQEIITNVVKACGDKIGARLRGDTALAKFLGSG